LLVDLKAIDAFRQHAIAQRGIQEGVIDLHPRRSRCTDQIVVTAIRRNLGPAVIAFGKDGPVGRDFIADACIGRLSIYRDTVG
jgi:hypothetical protein